MGLCQQCVGLALHHTEIKAVIMSSACRNTVVSSRVMLNLPFIFFPELTLMENSGLTAFEFAGLCCLLFCFLVIIDIPSLSKYFLTTGISAATIFFYYYYFLFLPFARNLQIFIYL